MNWKCFFGQHQWKILETRNLMKVGTSSRVGFWEHLQCVHCGKTMSKTHVY